MVFLFEQNKQQLPEIPPISHKKIIGGEMHEVVLIIAIFSFRDNVMPTDLTKAINHLFV